MSQWWLVPSSVARSILFRPPAGRALRGKLHLCAFLRLSVCLFSAAWQPLLPFCSDDTANQGLWMIYNLEKVRSSPSQSWKQAAMFLTESCGAVVVACFRSPSHDTDHEHMFVSVILGPAGPGPATGLAVLQAGHDGTRHHVQPGAAHEPAGARYVVAVMGSLCSALPVLSLHSQCCCLPSISCSGCHVLESVTNSLEALPQINTTPQLMQLKSR